MASTTTPIAAVTMKTFVSSEFEFKKFTHSTTVSPERRKRNNITIKNTNKRTKKLDLEMKTLAMTSNELTP